MRFSNDEILVLWKMVTEEIERWPGTIVLRDLPTAERFEKGYVLNMMKELDSEAKFRRIGRYSSLPSS
jgi:hypothetical protein